MKKLLLMFFTLFLVGCRNKVEEVSTFNIDVNDYAETVAFFAENFETESVPQSTIKDDYLKSYIEHPLSHWVTLYTNGKNQLAYIKLKGMSPSQVELVLKEVGLPEDDAEINLILSDPEEFESSHNQSYLMDIYNDSIGLHILANKQVQTDEKEIEYLYNVNIFYNLNVYEDFLNN